MLNKIALIIVLILSNFSTVYALNCLTVAEIGKTEIIGKVKILRTSKNHQPEFATKANRKLCPEDKVIVPKDILEIAITYYSEGPYQEVVKSGETYIVKTLDEPCGAWCKAKEKLENLWSKITNTEPSPKTKPAGGRGDDSIAHIFTPLADGAGSAEPFYLFVANEKNIPLFWKGGEPPYKLIVKDNKNQIVVQEPSLESGEFVFTSLKPEIGSEYFLTIKSTKDKTCHKSNSKFCNKKLIFTVPPFPIDLQDDPFMQLTRLLADCKKNWRLEIWRQLNAMPDSKHKQAFMLYLKNDNYLVSPYHEDIRLCP